MNRAKNQMPSPEVDRSLARFGKTNRPTMRSWVRHLRHRNRTPKTIVSYLGAARQLETFADGGDVLSLGHHELEEFFGSMLDRYRPT